jgi:hypothetical protein
LAIVNILTIQNLPSRKLLHINYLHNGHYEFF